MTVDLQAALDQLVNDFGRQHDCPSITWGVVLDGALGARGSYRAEQLPDGSTPSLLDEHTVYRIASMTKSFSAAATLLLRDEGVLRLDDPITDHAPELGALRGPTDDAATITIRDLLTMKSGFVADDAWADRHLDLTDDEFDAIVAAGVTFAGPTGAIHEYSNFGFAVLGRVVHRATGQRIQHIISERLLAPLGMHDSTWTQPAHDRWARPLRHRDDRFIDELAPLADGLIAPMGGIWTTVHDLALWVDWLDDAFPARDGDDSGPLCRASRREMQTEQAYVGFRTLRGVRSPTSYGFGLRVLDEAHRVVTHSGGLPGYGSNMRWLSGRRAGAIALANSTYAPMTELTALILDAVVDHGAVAVPPTPVSPAIDTAARRLVDLFNDWDDAVADELFADNVADDDPYDRRRAQVADLVPLVVDSVSADHDACATIHTTAVDGRRPTIWFALSPASDARIQDIEVSADED